MLIKTSSSFKFNKFFLNSFIVHFCKTGSVLTPFPAASTLTKVDDTPYPTPPLCIFTEIILPAEFIWGTNFASDPTPETTRSGGEL